MAIKVVVSHASLLMLAPILSWHQELSFSGYAVIVQFLLQICPWDLSQVAPAHRQLISFESNPTQEVWQLQEM